MSLNHIKDMLFGSIVVSLRLHPSWSLDSETFKCWGTDHGLGDCSVLRYDWHSSCLRILQRLLPETPGMYCLFLIISQEELIKKLPG